MTKEERIILTQSLIDQIRDDLAKMADGGLVSQCRTNLMTLETLIFGEKVTGHPMPSPLPQESVTDLAPAVVQ